MFLTFLSVDDAINNIIKTKNNIFKHLIAIRQEEIENKAISKPLYIKSKKTTIFKFKMITLLVGGLGGFGKELTHWLSEKNCGNIIITGRSGIKNNHDIYILSLVRAKGVRVIVNKIDMAYMEGARSISQ